MGRFGLIRVRSPLLTESQLFSLPAGTEMFHFPAFPPRTLCVQMRVTRSPHSVWRGFPIRTSWDHRSVINSPRLIADSYVLLRLLMPRHPPCALKNLTTQRSKTYLERTRKRSRFNIKNKIALQDARVHYVVLKQQPRPPAARTHMHGPTRGRNNRNTRSACNRCKTVLLPQDPTVCHTRTTATPRQHRSRHPPQARDTVPGTGKNRQPLFVDIPPMSTHRRTKACAMGNPDNPPPRKLRNRKHCKGLLRKEVIQPHLPVRLPCYDLVPIAGPTFDGSPHKG